MMRILLATGSFPPMRCGVGDYSLRLANALVAESSVRVGVLTSTEAEGAEVNDGVEVFPVIKKWSLLETQKVVLLVKNWSPDIVHIQYPAQGYGRGFLPWLLPLIAFLMRKKIVQTWHEGYGRRNALELLLKSIFPSYLVFVRPRYAENLHPQLHWALWRKKTKFIPNASAIPRAELSVDEARAIKQQYVRGQARLIVFFGFVYPHKGVDLIFEIANPLLDHIVIVGEVDESSEYCRKILRQASIDAWRGKVTITGFLSSADVASILASADAVILPFRSGGGEWNTSIHGAVLNGSLVITTSLSQNGYDRERNIYYARIDQIQEMKSAIEKYAGRKRILDSGIDRDGWQEIAHRHQLLYKSILTEQ